MQKESTADMTKLIQSELMKCMGQFFQQQPGGSVPNKAETNFVQDSAKRLILLMLTFPSMFFLACIKLIGLLTL